MAPKDRDDREHPETARLLRQLRLLFRVYDKTFADIETAAGLPPGSFSGAFDDPRELRVEHVVAFCEAVGLTPAEFFESVYFPMPSEASPAMLKLLEVQTLIGDRAARAWRHRPPTGCPFIIRDRDWLRLSAACRSELLEVLAGEGSGWLPIE